MIKPKEMAHRLGVTVRTLQRWDNEGLLKAHRNVKNRRYYTEEQYLSYIGASALKSKKIYAYVRVSSRGQISALENQISFIRGFVNSKGEILEHVYQDVASGLNYKRKEWNKLLFEEVMAGQVEKIYVTYKDRFVRFGFDWFERFCNHFGTEIVVIKNEDTSPESEMVKDLISIIHVFSSRMYGLRKYERQVKDDKGLQGRDKADRGADTAN